MTPNPLRIPRSRERIGGGLTISKKNKRGYLPRRLRRDEKQYQHDRRNFVPHHSAVVVYPEVATRYVARPHSDRNAQADTHNQLRGRQSARQTVIEKETDYSAHSARCNRRETATESEGDEMRRMREHESRRRPPARVTRSDHGPSLSDQSPYHSHPAPRRHCHCRHVRYG